MIKGCDNHLKPSVGKIEKGFPDALTDENTFSAFHTLFRIVGEERMGIIDGKITDKAPQGFGPEVPLQRGGNPDQLAGFPLRTILAIDMMVAHDQLKGCPSHPRYLFRMDVDFHLLTDRFRTGGDHLPAASDFHFDKAQTASSEGKFSALSGAEIGDVDPRTESRPENLFPRVCCYFFTINDQGWHEVSSLVTFYSSVAPSFTCLHEAFRRRQVEGE
jgi:hypothetical protein